VEIDSLELLVNWRLQRELNERWALGVEGYSEIEDLANAGSFDEQGHRLGPVEFPHAEGKPEWNAAGGVLFGLSDAVSDFYLQVRRSRVLKKAPRCAPHVREQDDG
jgi:hypothetical protein